ncbi:hypothetical protein [Vaginisenegalia massiliensis]|uniref:hypothetical protein n=1 Tax=Vaginisenegalia massiliensis TaxID=2058294 RepID=UPI000F535116|nr:hypothetical protein [Vaginisenegalia massiliensis]
MSNSSSERYIGTIAKVRFPYYDVTTSQQQFKLRPMLIIGAEKEYLPCDFTVLPVSRVSNPQNLSESYDIKLDKDKCVLLSLKKSPSYIRVHKQSYANSIDVRDDIISNLKELDLDLYEEIKEKHSEFNESLF